MFARSTRNSSQTVRLTVRRSAKNAPATLTLAAHPDCVEVETLTGKQPRSVLRVDVTSEAAVLLDAAGS